MRKTLMQITGFVMLCLMVTAWPLKVIILGLRRLNG